MSALEVGGVLIVLAVVLLLVGITTPEESVSRERYFTAARWLATIGVAFTVARLAAEVWSWLLP